MRQLTTATLAAAVALAFAQAAQAAAIPMVQGVPTLRGTTTAPSSASSSATNGNTSTTTTSLPIVNTTNVDVRAQQTQAATAVTHASGSTSAIAGVIGSASVNPVTGSVTGTGTTSGTGNGTTSGLGATGTNATGATIGLPVGGSGGFAPSSIIVSNPSDMTNGFAVANTTGIASGNAVYAASDVTGGASVLDNATVVAGSAAASGANVDRAIRQVSRDRQRIGRNGQLLNTIAPRTNADRSREMPDDPLPPSLTGSNSTLVR